MPALPTFLIEPLRCQFEALIPPVRDRHPLGCHRPRITDRLVFDKLIQVLVLGASYEKIGDTGCSATTIRRRRDAWINAGSFAALEQICQEAYYRIIGMELENLTVDGCIVKPPCGGELAGKSPVDRGKLGTKRSVLTDGRGIPLGRGTHQLMAQPRIQKLLICTEWKVRVIDAMISLANSIIILRRLIREAWFTHRWGYQPQTKALTFNPCRRNFLVRRRRVSGQALQACPETHVQKKMRCKPELSCTEHFPPVSMLVFELGYKIYTAPVTDDLDINPRCFQPLQGSLVVNILTDNDTSHTTDDDGSGAHRARRFGSYDENVLVRCERLLHDTAKTIQFGM
ncbi:hypothetical protein GCM10009628_03400 [Paeniglutamicibacter kerguelensis]|uniref:Transposase n=1 Tax=Paeniglutamicibacter kerguelensis TaxID=254788 RepID=A0ABS4XIX3_9MICC|nr:transposase [Paeniglutamicibacter kerguelensis]